jgi:serine/threonine protein phosphatase 1
MKTFVVGDVHGRCAQLLNLLDMLPRDADSDTLIFLGDLIDRGADSPGCVEHVLKMSHENPERVICLRGNHEQMLLDFLDGTSNMWLTPVTGGERTFEQYTGLHVRVDSEKDLEDMRHALEDSLPLEHLDFMQSTRYYHEDEYAIYVHAGLDEGKHPSESSAMSLLWMRDMDFYKNYRGKPCVFGHTPTPLLLCADDSVVTAFTSQTVQWVWTRVTNTLHHSVVSRCLTSVCIRPLRMEGKRRTKLRRSFRKR